MRAYGDLTQEEMRRELETLRSRYEAARAGGLKLNMSRGVPARSQLDLSQDMMNVLSSSDDYMYDGAETRSYGLPDGLPSAKRLFSEILDIPDGQIIVGNNSSLNMMYDMMVRGMCFGFSGCEPWSKQGKVKFICPVPGYDRHFTVCEMLGIEMIPVRMNSDGPDMDAVRELVRDGSVKGMWNVPKYSNPTGITYSDDVVRQLASLRPAAKDFRIFWDNAYCVHDLYEDGDTLLNIMTEAEAAGNGDMIFVFASTSKISFPGAGIACVAVGKGDYPYIKKLLGGQIICPDKINQLRHVLYFKDAEGVRAQMRRHAEIIRPKFEAVEAALSQELDGLGIARWTNPKGGYFISLDVMPHTAERVIALAGAAGVIVTPAGSTWPYHRDPDDSNIRIAPTYPTLAEIKLAAELIALCVRFAAAEKLAGERGDLI